MFRILCIFAIWIGWSSYHPIRGKSVAPSIISMADVIKSTDNMTKMKPLAQVLKEFKSIHGDRYIYTEINETNYHGSKSVVPIICRKHGLFTERVGHHLSGHGCKKCSSERAHVWDRTINKYGGVLDVDFSVNTNKDVRALYNVWLMMLERCNGDKTKSKHPTYESCSVCEEWKSFSVFYKWATLDENNYHIGYHIDKDILIKGNKVYSPDTCCFVPQEINKILVRCDGSRSDHPIGVIPQSTGRFLARCTMFSKAVNLGTYNTKEEAFLAYKQAKESYIKELATQYYNDGKITKKVYNALMRYEVEITD
jgi:hypothetical protein